MTRVRLLVALFLVECQSVGKLVVLERLVSVAHRQGLPWEVHLVEDDISNAFTPGGGLVVVQGRLIGEFVPPYDDDALAVVLAHEIAHVAHLHPTTRGTWQGYGALVNKRARDPYYRASFSTEQEAEADELGVLYLALAGYDPMAAPRLWESAHKKEGSSAARGGYLHSHPLTAARIRITRSTARKVSQYRISGQRNPDWESLLASNRLFRRVDLAGDKPGMGTVRTGMLILDTLVKHKEARREAKKRERAAQTLQALKITRVWEAATKDGYRGIFMDIHNGGSRSITGIDFAVVYYSHGRQVVGEDTSCRTRTRIDPGQTIQWGCYKLSFPGTQNVGVAIRDAAIR